jgi:ketosteroid isomerase-like protein
MTADETAVLAANDAFYRAFAARDLKALDHLWARRASVACIHPGWQALRGRESVMTSWKDILENPGAPAIACVHPSASVFGDIAFVICNERIPGAELIATNVFTREDGEWRMVHHHAGGVAHPSSEPEPSGTVH